MVESQVFFRRSSQISAMSAAAGAAMASSVVLGIVALAFVVFGIMAVRAGNTSNDNLGFGLAAGIFGLVLAGIGIVLGIIAAFGIFAS